MLKVGLTGGIATGKTTVGQMFVELGCHLIDSDQIAHELFEPGQDVYSAVIKAFGPSIVASDGTIDRKILGDIVFKDSTARAKLNILVHPAIIRRQQEFLDSVARTDPNGIGLVSAALMVEIGTYKNYDKLIVVSCPSDMQRGRLKARAALTDDQIDGRLAAQMPPEEKVKYADYVVDTSGDLAETRRQVREINSKLRELSGNTSDMRRS
jgi:dephospho-CoA kinase